MCAAGGSRIEKLLQGESMQITRLAAALAMATLACVSTAASALSITPYTVPSATSTALMGVNDRGVLVGFDDNGGFIDDHGQVTTVNLVGSPGYVAGISDDGLAVGSDWTSSFFYKAGVMTPFAIAGEAQTVLRSISANGRYAAGITYAADGSAKGFVLDTVSDRLATLEAPAGEQLMDLHGVNDSGVAVGNVIGGAGSMLFDSVSGSTTYFSSLAGLENVRARAIDDVGNISGYAVSGGGRWIGFYYSASDGLTTYDLGSNSTLVYGLNNAGLAVGSYENDDYIDHSFVINLSAVPEPATTTLMALALLAVGLGMRRRRTSPPGPGSPAMASPSA